MHFFKVLLAMPALTALAMPVAENEARSPSDASSFSKRGEDSVTPDLQPDYWKRDENVKPDFWKRDEQPNVHPDYWKRDDNVNPEIWKRDDQPNVHPDFWKRDDNPNVHPDFWKRDAVDQPTVKPDFWKRGDTPEVTPEIWKRYAPNHHLTLSANNKQRWERAAAIQQPNLPEIIDTGACICGLLTIEDTLPHNGELIEMWRCTAAINDDISKGSHGKWYNTTLPSQEVSGYGEPRDWSDNPPYVNQTYVLVSENGGAYYELLDAANSGALVGGDVNCTGVKDQAASAAFYTSQS